jgi:NitT/TauT family transport system substrate-binding protein
MTRMQRSPMLFRCLRYWRVAFAIPLLIALLASPPGARANERIRLSTWPSYGKNAPFFYANAKGYYANAGIKFEALSSFQHSLLFLQSGDAEIAQVATPEAVAHIDQGSSFIIVAMRDALSPIGTVSLDGSAIHTPKDYANKRWGHYTAFTPELRVIGWLGRAYGFDPASVHIANLDFRLRLASLIRGDVDFISGWWGSGFPAFQVAAEKQGVKLKFLRWSDFGVDIYGECLVARRDWALANPDLLRRFLAISAKSFDQSIVDSDGAVAAAIRAAPEVGADRDLIKRGWDQSKELLHDEHSRKRGLFWIETSKLQKTLETMDPAAKRPASFYGTNEYLSPRPTKLSGVESDSPLTSRRQ